MNLSNTFVTADQHFGHKNIIEYAGRRFSSVEQMDEELIRRWNEKVNPSGIVYVLGDFTLKDYDSAIRYASRLNGTIFFQPGSHDRWIEAAINDDFREMRESRGQWASEIPALYSIELPKKRGQKYSLPLVMCHYSMRKWDRSHYGSYHVYGHSHGKISDLGKSTDIGVDCTNFYPLSIQQVIARLDIEAA